MPEGLAHGLDGRAAVLEPLREARPQDAEIRALDSGFREGLGPSPSPARFRVARAALVRDEGFDLRRVEAEIAKPPSPSLQEIEDVRPHGREDRDAFSRYGPRALALRMLDTQGPSRDVQVGEPRKSKLLDAEAGVEVEGHRESDCFRAPIRDAFELPHRFRVPRVILDVHR